MKIKLTVVATVATVATLLAASTTNADRNFTFKYNFYHKTGTANHKFVGEHSSRMSPSTMTRYLSNPNVYAVPTNASSQYPSWNELWGTASRIPKPPQGCKRGGPNPRLQVCR